MIRSPMNAPFIMRNYHLRFSVRLFFTLCVLALPISGFHQSNIVLAQSGRPVLFSAPDSTRGVVIESVTSKREPFSSVAAISFAEDNRTRIMLIAGNLKLAPGEDQSCYRRR